ncbi:MAG: hypothetical protein ACYDGR_16940 [Candidatus Dormibacteria bacterium]
MTRGLNRMILGAAAAAVLSGLAGVGALADVSGEYIASPPGFTVSGTNPATGKGVGAGGYNFELKGATAITVTIKDDAAPSINGVLQFEKAGASNGGVTQLNPVGPAVDICGGKSADNIQVPDGVDYVGISVNTGGLKPDQTFACGGANPQGTHGVITIAGIGAPAAAPVASGRGVTRDIDAVVTAPSVTRQVFSAAPVRGVTHQLGRQPREL